VTATFFFLGFYVVDHAQTAFLTLFFIYPPLRADKVTGFFLFFFFPLPSVIQNVVFPSFIPMDTVIFFFLVRFLARSLRRFSSSFCLYFRASFSQRGEKSYIHFFPLFISSLFESFSLSSPPSKKRVIELRFFSLSE